MRRQIIVMFFGLFLLGAPPAWADAGVAPATQVQQRGALFKVQGGGNTLYLFGTMHVGLPEFYPLEPRIEAAVAKSPVLALEIDATRDPAALAGAMQKYGLFAPGSRGYQDMPAALRPRLEKVLGGVNIDMKSASMFKPWLLSTLLALGEFAKLGYRPDLAVESHLSGLARAGKVPVVELESATAQLALFGSLSEADQWQVLEDTVAAIEVGKQGEQVRQIVDAWRTADQAALDAIALRAENDTTFSGRFVQKVLLEGRNGPLADKIAAMLARDNNSVAAIGVLHLVGKHSVPTLLKQRGLSVERVY